MAEYAELIKALRLCQFGECGCGKCYYKELKGDWCTEDNHPEFFDCDDKLKLDAAAAIEALQAQLPKRGEWIVRGANRVDCSVCGHSICFAFGLSEGSLTGYNYCPNCGAKMEVQE